jgi:hypothetical protein
MKFQNLSSTIMKSNWRLFFPFFVLLMANLEIQAQSDRPQWWYTYNHTGRFSDRWGYAFDLNHRSNGVVPFNSTLSAARMGMTYHTKPVSGLQQAMLGLVLMFLKSTGYGCMKTGFTSRPSIRIVVPNIISYIGFA